jgi:ABC-type branched-subunit amino acid transport system substrate-binding protein
MKDQAMRLVSAKAAWITASLVIVASLLSTFTLSTPEGDLRTSVAGGAGEQSSGEVVDGAGNVVGGGGGGTTPSAGGGGGGASGRRSGGGDTTRYDCAQGQNAGASDTGVTDREVRFAATVVRTGIAKDFLADAQWGIEAVRQKVNRDGGVCGRIISVDYKDDGWDPSTGQRIIEGFIGENRYLGLAVNPSSEGLRGPIDSGLITRNRFPVVGADGQLINQYQDPWVWPVATSTASVMHVMAHNAYQRGARTFGIVWEQNFRFGVEGHAAFVGAVKRLGGTVSADTALQGGQTDYSNQVDDFIGSCGGVNSLEACDFVAMLLEPATASQWVRNGGLGNGEVRPEVGIGAPQPLFLTSFARDCGRFCAGMWVWTSFKPPLAPFDSEAAVAQYRADLEAVSQTADPNNPHVQGAYVGMQLLVEGLRQLGPAPSREGLREVLDGITLDSGLAPPLRFSPGNHFAATGAQAFEAIVNNNSFNSWRHVQGFVDDPEVGKDIPD